MDEMTHEEKLLWIKLSMLIAGTQAGKEYWDHYSIDGPFDMDQIAAVKSYYDDGWVDHEWDRQFRPAAAEGVH